MWQRETTLEQNEYRLVLLTSGSHKTWVERSGCNLRLPRIAIPRWSRPAMVIQGAIEGRWGHSAIVLDVFSGSEDSSRCAVVEVISPQPQNGMTAVGLDELPKEELADDEKQVVEAILIGKSGTRGPFSRLGWIGEAIEWLRAVVGYKVVDARKIRQYGGGGHFALVHFSVDRGRGWWMKAAGLHNRHEFNVTRTLADLFPNYLPPLVASREDWCAWLTEDAGAPLESAISLPAFESAIHSLVGLQIESISHIERLLACGCADQRLSNLAALVPQLIDRLSEAMCRQTSTKAEPLTPSRLRELEKKLRDAFARMEEIEIPDGLLHNDVNLGNFLVGEGHCVLTDWAEACVGNPFFTFQNILVQAAREARGQDWTASLNAIYQTKWAQLLSTSQIEEGLRIAPLLAIASHLVGRGDWISAQNCNQPHADGYARSLARAMDRLARRDEFLGALCH
jgi:phosphotransferase family enzyme